MTIGDVLAAIAAVALVAGGWMATLLLAALAFPVRVRRAEEALAATPGVCLARGVGFFLVVGLFAVMLINQAAGPVRLLGGALLAGLSLASALGGAGIINILGACIREQGTDMTPFATLTRGTALYVLAGLLPMIGWFLITPLALMLSLGSAFAALRPAHADAGRGMAGHAPTAVDASELGARASS